MIVRVFRNLHTHAFSIQHKTGASWRTAAHASGVVVRHGLGHVQASGRDRVRRGKCKTVHAWIEGELCAWSGMILRPGLILPQTLDQVRALGAAAQEPIRYDPATLDHFCGANGVRAGRREMWRFEAPGQVWASPSWNSRSQEDPPVEPE